MPLITAQRASPCRRCSMPIVVGERIDFTRARGALHLACAEECDDPEDDIRIHYRLLLERGFDDPQAFQACAQDYRYVPTVRALLMISAYAKQRDDAFRARRRAG